MSAPNANIERQKRNHRGPLVGIAVVLVVVGLALVIFLGDETDPDGTLLGEGAATSAPAGVEATTSD
ncbi:hypothetical protein EOK75_14190 (plasmid) [Pseudorhodobacter turbinis]|uniref:Uncharacterized protein n=1 Tax=Pseudorhodobacter turbinis TaxID=2500533 RepID=A0A4P8EIZ8_9RHOB|nr:hypothetical protein [Pseudorhodobacter turbinis]QCO56947.1 hypothetical protein EOK75_14190 [Pseudorhodobacter turbinis]